MTGHRPEDYGTEAAARERRIVAHVLNALNVAFAAVDAARYGLRPGLAMGGRLVVTVALTATPLLLARPLPPRWQRAIVQAAAALAAAGFGLLVLGSGGPASPYLGFLGVLPIVLAMVVPDDPWASLACGAVAALFAFLASTGTGAPNLVFIGLALTSATGYGVVGAALYRRMLLRERASAAERERTLAELAQIERRQLAAERLAAVGRLAAGVAHEINNPLSFITGSLDFARKELGERVPAEVAEALRDVEAGVERIGRIAQDLKALSRSGPERVGPTDVPRAVDEALRLASFRLRPPLRLDTRVSGDLPWVRADPTRLVQVLLNLLLNAGDALEEAGRLGRKAPATVTVTARCEGNSVLLSVEDTGPGFSPEALTHLFQPFFTTKEGGTGLGLALSREYVARWNGTIEAGNVAGSGARVTVALHAEA
jgi:signal transduction histidine kinase